MEGKCGQLRKVAAGKTNGADSRIPNGAVLYDSKRVQARLTQETNAVGRQAWGRHHHPKQDVCKPENRMERKSCSQPGHPDFGSRLAWCVFLYTETSGVFQRKNRIPHHFSAISAPGTRFASLFSPAEPGRSGENGADSTQQTTFCRETDADGKADSGFSRHGIRDFAKRAPVAIAPMVALPSFRRLCRREKVLI